MGPKNGFFSRANRMIRRFFEVLVEGEVEVRNEIRHGCEEMGGNKLCWDQGLMLSRMAEHVD